MCGEACEEDNDKDRGRGEGWAIAIKHKSRFIAARHRRNNCNSRKMEREARNFEVSILGLDNAIGGYWIADKSELFHQR